MLKTLRYVDTLKSKHYLSDSRNDSQTLGFTVYNFNYIIVKIYINSYNSKLQVSSPNGKEINVLMLALIKNPDLVLRFNYDDMKNYFTDDDLKSLINGGDDEEMSPLVYSVSQKKLNYKVIEHLLDSWSEVMDLTIKDSKGKTSLYYAIERRDKIVVEKILGNYKCPNGENENCFTKWPWNNETPYDLSFKNLWKTMAKLLLSHNPDCGRKQVSIYKCKFA